MDFWRACANVWRAWADFTLSILNLEQNQAQKSDIFFCLHLDTKRKLSSFHYKFVLGPEISLNRTVG